MRTGRARSTISSAAASKARSTAARATINIPDTVGYAYPEEFADLIGMFRKPGAEHRPPVISSTPATTISASRSPQLAARGRGRRPADRMHGQRDRRSAGNAAMEEIVMAIRTRQDRLPYRQPDRHPAHHARLAPGQRGDRLCGAEQQGDRRRQRVRPRGGNSPGRHAEGRRDLRDYGGPEDVRGGALEPGEGKHSGRHAFRKKLAELGYALGDNALAERIARFEAAADKKKIFDEDLIALVDDGILTAEPADQGGRAGRAAAGRGRSRWRASCSRSTAPSARPKPRATARSTPPSTRSSSWSRTTRRCRLFRFTRSPRAPIPGRSHGPSGREWQNRYGEDAETDTILASARAYVTALSELFSRTRKNSTSSPVRVIASARLLPGPRRLASVGQPATAALPSRAAAPRVLGLDFLARNARMFSRVLGPLVRRHGD